jgi:hypothetical protein
MSATGVSSSWEGPIPLSGAYCPKTKKGTPQSKAETMNANILFVLELINFFVLFFY